MRAREILDEDYNQSLDSDLNNLLIGAKGSDNKEVKTQNIVSIMQSMGYSIDINSLMTLLQDNPAVANVTPDSITLSNPESTGGMDDPTQDSAARVGDMAQKATKIS